MITLDGTWYRPAELPRIMEAWDGASNPLTVIGLPDHEDQLNVRRVLANPGSGHNLPGFVAYDSLAIPGLHRDLAAIPPDPPSIARAVEYFGFLNVPLVRNVVPPTHGTVARVVACEPVALWRQELDALRRAIDHMDVKHQRAWAAAGSETIADGDLDQTITSRLFGRLVMDNKSVQWQPRGLLAAAWFCLAREHGGMVAPCQCSMCGRVFVATRSDQRWCGDACKMRRSRWRRRKVAELHGQGWRVDQIVQEMKRDGETIGPARVRKWLET